ncbi:MAG: lysylphosphatidylglycerol synthase transmembrane domain-containing protein [Anaerolineales bacterium]
MVRRWFTFGLGLMFSALFAYIGFRGLNFSELVDILTQINAAWLLIAVVIFFIAVYILTWRWHYLLYPIRDIHPNKLYTVVVIGYMGNNIYPARIGEFIRAYLLKRNDDVPYAPSLATILIERIFDGLAMLSFVFVALLFVEFDEPLVTNVVRVTTPLFFIALGIFTVFALRPDLAARVYTPVINLLVPGKIREPLLTLIAHFMSGISALRQPRLFALTAFATLASWTVEASTYWFVLQAFDFELTFWVLLLLVGLANLMTILPSTPGYVGTFHGVAVLTLTAFGVDGEQAGAYAIVMHMVLWLPITLVGAALFWQQGMQWRELGRASQVVESEASA